MLSAVPNFFIDPSGHCDSSEIIEHIIPEVILSMITSVTPSSQLQLDSSDDSQFRNLVSFLLWDFTLLALLAFNLTVLEKSAILNFEYVKYLFAKVPHEHKCVSICKRLHILYADTFHTTGFLAASTAGCVLYA